MPPGYGDKLKVLSLQVVLMTVADGDAFVWYSMQTCS